MLLSSNIPFLLTWNLPFVRMCVCVLPASLPFPRHNRVLTISWQHLILVHGQSRTNRREPGLSERNHIVVCRYAVRLVPFFCCCWLDFSTHIEWIALNWNSQRNHQNQPFPFVFGSSIWEWFFLFNYTSITCSVACGGRTSRLTRPVIFLVWWFLCSAWINCVWVLIFGVPKETSVNSAVKE